MKSTTYGLKWVCKVACFAGAAFGGGLHGANASLFFVCGLRVSPLPAGSGYSRPIATARGPLGGPGRWQRVENTARPASGHRRGVKHKNQEHSLALFYCCTSSNSKSADKLNTIAAAPVTIASCIIIIYSLRSIEEVAVAVE